jgi:prevent-host-death family protein
MNVNVLDAKTNLSKLIQRALNGEDIVLARNGTPAVRLVPISKPKTLRPMGLGKKSKSTMTFLQDRLRHFQRKH